MKCYTNCNYIKNPDQESEVKIIRKKYDDMIKILANSVDQVGIIGLDLETYAPKDIVHSLEVYISMRQDDYEEEGKNPNTKTALKKFENEYKEIKKDVALNPLLNAIRLAAINTGSEILIFDLVHVQCEDEQDLWNQVSKCSIVGQNVKFDIKSIKAKYDWFEPYELFDTMTGNRLARTREITGRFSSNLKSVVEHWTGVELPKELGGSDWGGIITQDMLEYSYFDVYYLLDILIKQIDYFNEHSVNKTNKKPYFQGMLQDRVAIIEMRFVYPLLEMELKGCSINKPYLENKLTELEVEHEKLKKIFKDVNTNSPKQLQEFLINKGVYCEGTGRPALLPFRDHKVVRDLLQIKAVQKQVQMVRDYLEKWIDPTTTRIFASFNQQTAPTGRMSCTSPNLQQIPAKNVGKGIKQNFYLPKRGRKIFKADYPSIEARIMGEITKDDEILRIFNQPESVPKYDRDMHYSTAAEFYGKDRSDITEDERKPAKSANFGFMFGMGAQKYREFAYNEFDLDIDEEEAFRQKRAYFKLYKKVQRFHYRNGEILRKHDRFIAKSLLGRQMMVDTYTNANNYPIQSSAADILKLACVLFYQKVREIRIDAFIINMIHDEIVVECSSKHYKLAKKTLKNCMEVAVNFVIKSFETKIEIEE